MKLISVVTPCYNEEENVEAIYTEIKRLFEAMPGYCYEHIFIDNASEDQTVPLLKTIARKDRNVKVIVNNRNFGPVRSPYYGMLQASGDAVIQIVADFQEPPACIPELLRRWEEGEKLVLGIKTNSEENPIVFFLRSTYYKVLNRISNIKLINHATGFGLYDREVIEVLRRQNDCYPYLRGLISELGFPVSEVHYLQPKRQRGVTKNNFYVLYDWAMLGMTSHSRVPLRLAAMIGFLTALFCLLLSLFYLGYKLLFWDNFSVGIAPVVIGLFFIGAVQLFFIGMLGEYIGAIYTQVLHRPLVVEKERINFDAPVDAALQASER